MPATRYAVYDDLKRRFGEAELIRLTASADATAPDFAKIDQAIDDASELIESYLRKQYTLPLAAIPPRLVECACHLARYNLYTDVPTDHVETRFKTELAWLEALAANKATLGLDDAQEPRAEGVAVQGGSSPRVFSNESLAPYLERGRLTR